MIASTHTPRQHRWSTLVGVFGLALLIFIGGLGQKDLVTSHEARVAQTARVMADSGSPWNAKPQTIAQPVLVEENGQKRFREGSTTILVNPWIIPTLNGQLRLNKPPLPYWCSAVVFKLFGVSEFSARLPTSILGALACVLMINLGTQLYNPKVGLIAAMLWLSTYFVIDEFRKSMSDPYLAFFTLLAIVAFLRGGIGTLIAYLAIGLGMLAKGPVILLTVIPAVLILALPCRVSISKIGLHVLGIILAIAVALPWAIAVTHQIANARELWLYDAFESVEKARPFWMYFANLFQLTLPWTPFWIIALILPFLHGKRSARNPTRWRIIGWAVFIVICFSIKPVKKNAYLLPVMPALILMTAEAIQVMLRIASRFPSRPLPWTIMAILSAVGIGFACAIGGFAVKNELTRSIGIATAVIAILAALPPMLEVSRGRSQRWLTTEAISFGVLTTLFLSMWNASTENLRSPRPIAAKVLMLSQADLIPIAVAPSPEEFSFYLPLDVPNWRAADRVLLVLDKPSPDELNSRDFIQARFSNAIVESWGAVWRDSRYVVVDVILNRNRM